MRKKMCLEAKRLNLKEGSIPTLFPSMKGIDAESETGGMVPFTGSRVVQTKWARAQDGLLFAKHKDGQHCVYLLCARVLSWEMSVHFLKTCTRTSRCIHEVKIMLLHKCLLLSAVHMNGRVKKKQILNTGPIYSDWRQRIVATMVARVAETPR